MKRRIPCIPALVILSVIFFAWLFLPGARRAAAADTNVPANAAPAAPVAPPLEVADRFMLAIPKAGLGKDYQFTGFMARRNRNRKPQ